MCTCTSGIENSSFENQIIPQNNLFTEARTFQQIPQGLQNEYNNLLNINIYKTNHEILPKISNILSSNLKNQNENANISVTKKLAERKRASIKKDEMNGKLLTIYRRTEKYNYIFNYDYKFYALLKLEKFIHIFSELNIPNFISPLFDEDYEIVEKEEDRFSFFKKVDVFCDNILNNNKINNNKINNNKIIYENNFENFSSIMLNEQEQNLIEEKIEEGILSDYLKEINLK